MAKRTTLFSDMLTKNPHRIGTKASISWLRKQASSMKKYTTGSIIDTAAPFRKVTTLSGNSIGRMYMFVYDPKTKEQLPYYDTFPLIFPIEFYKDGMLGINLHYLSPVLRAKLMDQLYDTINNDKYDSTTKLRISYRLLAAASRYQYFKPCIKRYLFSHVRSPFISINPKEWDYALMLPTERFVKASKDTVFADSRGLFS